MCKFLRRRNLKGIFCLLGFAAAATAVYADDDAPAIAAVMFHAFPARGGTYERGERVQIEVRFDRAVEATGSPRVALTIGTHTRYATFSSWGDQSLYFDYTVQEQDRDEDGISIAANALSLDGGTIRSADGTTDADLTHGAVAAWSSQQVNGSRASPPVVTTIGFFGPARGDTYQRGETIELLVEFHRAVVVTGNPQLALTIGDHTRQASHSEPGWDDRFLSFGYVVQEGDRDTDGIAIPANALTTGGGTVRDADGSADADLTHAPETPGFKVDSGVVIAPALTAIYLDNHVPPPTGDTYVRGERIRVWVEFDQEVAVTGSPRVALTVGGHTRHADYSGFSVMFTADGGRITENDVLSFDYLVQATDRDEDGVSIPANALVLNGGTIKHAGDGSTDADLTQDAAPDDPTRKVDGSRTVP
jgi:hypothetical protein